MKSVYHVLLVLLVGAECREGICGEQPDHGGGSSARPPLPGILDELYKGSPPAYLTGMHQLDELFSGIAVDLSEEDMAGAQDTLIAFKVKYREVGGLVPEWSARYPSEPVEELEKSVLAGDREKTMAAYGAIGNLCHECHVDTMVPVQQKYHWGNVGAIAISDPVIGDQTDYAVFKKRLSASFSGIGHNLKQDQVEHARKQFQQFRARFETLEETCFECHDSDPCAFIDLEAEKRIVKLGAVLASDDVSRDAVASLLQSIGRDTCSKCHLVHVPAAVAGNHSVH